MATAWQKTGARPTVTTSSLAHGHVARLTRFADRSRLSVDRLRRDARRRILNFSAPVSKMPALPRPPETEPGRAGPREEMRFSLENDIREEKPMNCHALSVCAVATLGLAVSPGPSIAQQKSAKDMLVGAWTLLLADGVKADGTHVPEFGPNPDGILMFSPSGRYALQIERANLPKIKANDREKPTAEESKAIAAGTLAHFGTYTVNDADKSFITHVEASSYPNWNGTKQTRKITALTDDVLTYSDRPHRRRIQPCRAGVAEGEITPSQEA